MVSVIKITNIPILRIKTHNWDVRTSSSKCQQSFNRCNVHAPQLCNLYTRAKILLFVQNLLSAGALRVWVWHHRLHCPHIILSGCVSVLFWYILRPTEYSIILAELHLLYILSVNSWHSSAIIFLLSHPLSTAIRTRSPTKQADTVPRLGPGGHWERFTSSLPLRNKPSVLYMCVQLHFLV